MFLIRNNSDEGIRAKLGEYSDDSCFSSSDHRLLAARLDIPYDSARIKYIIPSRKARFK